MLERIPTIDWALAAAVAVSAMASAAATRRGGQFRGMPGWSGFWVGFAGLLICLSRLPHYVSFPLLGLAMFAALRAYFFIAPLRPRDRNVILLSYAAIPAVLWLAYDSAGTFLATVPVALFLVLPFFLALAPEEEGFFDALGRTLLAVVLFVFCLAHLGLLVDEPPPGLPELFGVLVLAAELPQRLAGRFRPGSGWLQPALGALIGLLSATAAGYLLGPECALGEEDGARGGALVALATTLGAVVAEALARDLAVTASASVFGRGAFLNRTVSVVCAAPVFFHYLNHFA